MPDSELIFAVDLGATSTKAALVSRDGSLQSTIHRRRTKPPVLPDQIVNIIEQLSSRSRSFHSAVIGFPGIVESGRVKSPENLAAVGGPGSPRNPEALAAWNDFDLRQAAGVRLGVPVVVANDADVAAMGCAQGRGRELTVTLGSGVGTGFVIDGVLQDHVEHPILECFGETEVDMMVGEATRKTLDSNEWERRVHSLLGELITKFSCDRCYAAGGNARRLHRDQLHSFAVPVWVVDQPVGLLGAVGVADQG
jgi:polyphosphate glucokinase